MPNSVLTPTEIREEIFSRLGDSQLDIELSQSDLDKATREAVRLYSRHAPMNRWSTLAATPSQRRYVLDPAQHPGLTGVLDVQFLTRRTEPGAIDIFDPHETVAGNLMAGNETYGDIAQRESFHEDAARIVSADPEWRGEWEGGSYVLYVAIVRQPIQVSYMWQAAYTPDADAETGMQLIPEHNTDWVLDYIEARCMVTLGRVRRKFGGIPNPEGSSDETDGSAFADEGAQKIEALTEELKRRRPPLPPITG